MKRGDIVIAAPTNALRCGAGWYSHAICVQADPMVLVSETGDMMWQCMKPEQVMALCQAAPSVCKRAFARFKADTEGESK